MSARSETDLYAPVKRFLEELGYEVKSEVHDCDVVAVKPGQEQPLIVELKRSFGLPAIYQGIDRLRLSDRVYLAVEMREGRGRSAARKWRDAVRLCRMLGLGLITVKFHRQLTPRVDILCDPEPYRPARSRRGTERLMEEFRRRTGDYNLGGSARTKLITAYRERALECAYWLRQAGEPLRTKELRDLTGYAAVDRLLRDNHYGWFERVRNGVYGLTEEGRQALETYRHVVSHKFVRAGEEPESDGRAGKADGS
jgi:hypothetical protein